MAKNSTTQPTPTKKHRGFLPVALTPDEVELMKFVIGLRLLGEERAKRYVTYLRHLRDDPKQKTA